MTVEDLIHLLKQFPKKAVVYQAADPEGNGYHKTVCVERAHPDNEDISEKKAVVLWP